MPRNRPTFSTFLRTKIDDETHVGEFARDWLKDTHNGRPRGAFSWRAVRGHLESCGACDAALAAASTAWTEWELSDMRKWAISGNGEIKPRRKAGPPVQWAKRAKADKGLYHGG